MSTSQGNSYIVFDDVEVRYNEYVYGLRSVSLSIERGEFVFLVGNSGAGKSTLLKVLTREVRHDEGVALFQGRDLGHLRQGDIPLLRREMGIVPQDFALLPRMVRDLCGELDKQVLVLQV